MMLARCPHVTSSMRRLSVCNRLRHTVAMPGCASLHTSSTTTHRRQRASHTALYAKGKLGRLVDELREEKLPVVTKLTWPSPLDIVLYPDPRLRKENAKVAVFDDSLRQLAEEMFTVMYAEPGVGLAAPQVGVNVRLMVFNEAGERGKGREYILVNPVISNSGSRVVLGEEGCLSFPKIYGDVARSEEVTVKAQNEKGEDVELNLKGWVARIFQHEYDHLQGVLFHDRMVASSLELARSQLTSMEQEYLLQNPGAKILGPPTTAVQGSGGKKAGFGAGGAKKGFFN